VAVTLYWTVQLASIADPTEVQIRTGLDGTGAALPATQKGSEPYTTGGVYTEATQVVGLVAGTNYDLNWVAYDDEALTYSAIAKTIFTTDAGGTVYPVAKAESVALADTATVATIYVVARAESVALADSQDATITTGPAVYDVARAESVALADSQSVGPSTYNGATSESIAFTDTSTGVVPVAGLNTAVESIGLVDVATARGIFVVTRPETVGFSDSYNVSVTYSVSRAESVALTDTSTGTTPTVLTGTVNESFSLIAQQDAFKGVLPTSKIGHFGDPKKEGIKEAERAMIQLEDEFILEIVLSLAVKGAIA